MRVLAMIALGGLGLAIGPQARADDPAIMPAGITPAEAVTRTAEHWTRSAESARRAWLPQDLQCPAEEGAQKVARDPLRQFAALLTDSPALKRYCGDEAFSLSEAFGTPGVRLVTVYTGEDEACVEAVVPARRFRPSMCVVLTVGLGWRPAPDRACEPRCLRSRSREERSVEAAVIAAARDRGAWHDGDWIKLSRYKSPRDHVERFGDNYVIPASGPFWIASVKRPHATFGGIDFVVSADGRVSALREVDTR